MKRIIILILFTVIAFSCEKEYYTTIPNFSVYFELRLSFYEYELKNTDLAYKTFTQPRLEVEKGKMGYGGLLVINGISQLFAYDLACPVEAQRNIHVVPDNLSSSTSVLPTAIKATCPECGAIFNIADGSGAPQSGTKYYLRSYRVVESGMKCIVTN